MRSKIKKSINTLLALLIITALILMPGCTKEEEVVEDVLPVVNEITFTTYNQFALDLLKNTREEDENIILSPLSIGITLTMLRMGSDGETAAQIDEVLGMTIDDYDVVTQQCADIITRLNDLSSVWYETGLGLYIDEGPSVIESFAVMLEEYFFMDIEFMEFDSDTAEDEMNEWADIATSGRVEKLVRTDELDHDLMTLLVNLSAFDCEWEVEFNEDNTRSLPFTMTSGKGVAVPMMRGKLAMDFYEDEDVTAAFIPMSGRELSLAIILPAEDTLLVDFIDDLTAEDIETWRYIAVETENYVNIPEIDWQQIISYEEVLTQMGAGDMFVEELADFSNLGNDFYLGDLWQTTIFTASESGEEESELTNIDLTRAQGQDEYFFTVNRPFIFAVIDEESGGILIIGTMANPLEDNAYITEDD